MQHIHCDTTLPPLRLGITPQFAQQYPFQIPFEFSFQCVQRLANLVERVTSDRRVITAQGTIYNVDDNDNQSTGPRRRGGRRKKTNGSSIVDTIATNNEVFTSLNPQQIHEIDYILMEGFLVPTAYLHANRNTRFNSKNKNNNRFGGRGNNNNYNNNNNNTNGDREVSEELGDPDITELLDRLHRRRYRRGAKNNGNNNNNNNSNLKKNILQQTTTTNKKTMRNLTPFRDIYSQPHPKQYFLNSHAPLPTPFSQAYLYTLRILILTIHCYIRLTQSTRSSVMLRAWLLLMYLHKHFALNFSRFCLIPPPQYLSSITHNTHSQQQAQQQMGQLLTSPSVSQQSPAITLFTKLQQHCLQLIHNNENDNNTVSTSSIHRNNTNPTTPLPPPNQHLIQHPNIVQLWLSHANTHILARFQQHYTTQQQQHQQHVILLQHNILQQTILYTLQNCYNYYMQHLYGSLPSFLMSKFSYDKHLSAMNNVTTCIHQYKERHMLLQSTSTLSIPQTTIAVPSFMQQNKKYKSDNHSNHQSENQINFNNVNNNPSSVIALPTILYDYELDAALYKHYLRQMYASIQAMTLTLHEAEELALQEQQQQQEENKQKHSIQTTLDDTDDVMLKTLIGKGVRNQSTITTSTTTQPNPTPTNTVSNQILILKHLSTPQLQFPLLRGLFPARQTTTIVIDDQDKNIINNTVYDISLQYSTIYDNNNNTNTTPNPTTTTQKQQNIIFKQYSSTNQQFGLSSPYHIASIFDTDQNIIDLNQYYKNRFENQSLSTCHHNDNILKFYYTNQKLLSNTTSLSSSCSSLVYDFHIPHRLSVLSTICLGLRQDAYFNRIFDIIFHQDNGYHYDDGLSSPLTISFFPQSKLGKLYQTARDEVIAQGFEDVIIDTDMYKKKENDTLLQKHQKQQQNAKALINNLYNYYTTTFNTCIDIVTSTPYAQLELIYTNSYLYVKRMNSSSSILSSQQQQQHVHQNNSGRYNTINNNSNMRVSRPYLQNVDQIGNLDDNDDNNHPHTDVIIQHGDDHDDVYKYWNHEQQQQYANQSSSQAISTKYELMNYMTNDDNSLSPSQNQNNEIKKQNEDLDPSYSSSSTHNAERDGYADDDHASDDDSEFELDFDEDDEYNYLGTTELRYDDDNDDDTTRTSEITADDLWNTYDDDVIASELQELRENKIKNYKASLLQNQNMNDKIGNSDMIDSTTKNNKTHNPTPQQQHNEQFLINNVVETCDYLTLNLTAFNPQFLRQCYAIFTIDNTPFPIEQYFTRIQEQEKEKNQQQQYNLLQTQDNVISSTDTNSNIGDNTSSGNPAGNDSNNDRLTQVLKQISNVDINRHFAQLFRTALNKPIEWSTTRPINAPWYTRWGNNKSDNTNSDNNNNTMVDTINDNNDTIDSSTTSTNDFKLPSHITMSYRTTFYNILLLVAYMTSQTYLLSLSYQDFTVIANQFDPREEQDDDQQASKTATTTEENEKHETKTTNKKIKQAKRNNKKNTNNKKRRGKGDMHDGDDDDGDDGDDGADENGDKVKPSKGKSLVFSHYCFTDMFMLDKLLYIRRDKAMRYVLPSPSDNIQNDNNNLIQNNNNNNNNNKGLGRNKANVDIKDTDVTSFDDIPLYPFLFTAQTKQFYKTQQISKIISQEYNTRQVMIKRRTPTGRSLGTGEDTRLTGETRYLNDVKLWYTPLEITTNEFYITQHLAQSVATTIPIQQQQQQHPNNVKYKPLINIPQNVYVSPLQLFLKVSLPLPPPVQSAKLLTSIYPIFIITMRNVANQQHSHEQQMINIDLLSKTKILNNNTSNNNKNIYNSLYTSYYLNILQYLLYIECCEQNQHLQCITCRINPLASPIKEHSQQQQQQQQQQSIQIANNSTTTTTTINTTTFPRISQSSSSSSYKQIQKIIFNKLATVQFEEETKNTFKNNLKLIIDNIEQIKIEYLPVINDNIIIFYNNLELIDNAYNNIIEYTDAFISGEIIIDDDNDNNHNDIINHNNNNNTSGTSSLLITAMKNTNILKPQVYDTKQYHVLFQQFEILLLDNVENINTIKNDCNVILDYYINIYNEKLNIYISFLLQHIENNNHKISLSAASSSTSSPLNNNTNNNNKYLAQIKYLQNIQNNKLLFYKDDLTKKLNDCINKWSNIMNIYNNTKNLIQKYFENKNKQLLLYQEFEQQILNNNKRGNTLGNNNNTLYDLNGVAVGGFGYRVATTTSTTTTGGSVSSATDNNTTTDVDQFHKDILSNVQINPYNKAIVMNSNNTTTINSNNNAIANNNNIEINGQQHQNEQQQPLKYSAAAQPGAQLSRRQLRQQGFSEFDDY